MPQNTEQDAVFMQRCIELSQQSLDHGDAPFGSLITKDNEIIAEGINDSKSRISEHAEVIALHNAHMALNTSDLSGCALYTSCEPCPMCSFMIREYKISRVVYALHSNYMGGHNKWNILEDRELERFPPFFANPPEVISGFLEQEAKEVMRGTPFWMFGANPKKLG